MWKTPKIFKKRFSRRLFWLCWHNVLCQTRYQAHVSAWNAVRIVLQRQQFLWIPKVYCQSLFKNETAQTLKFITNFHKTSSQNCKKSIFIATVFRKILNDSFRWSWFFPEKQKKNFFLWILRNAKCRKRCYLQTTLAWISDSLEILLKSHRKY